MVGNWLNTRFWEDLLVGEAPFNIKFARLYNLTFSTGIRVAEVFEEGWNCVRFRRTLQGETANMWMELQNLCGEVVLTEQRDKCKWLLEKSGQFTVKSLYSA